MMTALQHRCFHKIVGLCLFAIATLAFAEIDNGPYVGISGGFHILPNMRTDFVDTTGLLSVMNSTDPVIPVKFVFQNGQNLGLLWGFQDYAYRYEIEANYFTTGFDSAFYTTLSHAGVNGRLRAINTMFNFIYQWLDRSPHWAPFVGAGAGAEKVTAYMNSGVAGQIITGTPLFRPTATISDTVFAYQGIAGFDYHYDNHWSLRTEYHYLRTKGVLINVRDATFAMIQARRDRVLTHLLRFALTYHF